MNFLIRHSSIVALFTMILFTALLGYFYHVFTKESLISAQQQASLALTKSYANSMWPGHAGFVSNSTLLDQDELKNNEEIHNIRRELRLLFRGIDVLNIILLDLKGRVVYSSDKQQIGSSRSTDARFISAREGQVQSTLAFHDLYKTENYTMHDRYIVTSYVPIRILDAAPVEGVLAIDSDTTSLMNELVYKQTYTMGWLIFLMSLMYGLIFAFTNRAERLLRAQQLQREKDIEHMRFLAYHDSLTGLPNRARFNELVEETVCRAKQDGWTVTVMFLDLDRFKLINDSLGHDAGDQLLCIIAQRIRNEVRKCDTLFRMGGDEFTVILEDVKPEQATDIVQRILGIINNPIHLKDEEFMISASVGLAVYPRDGESAELLVKSADTAMYRAKELGRGCFTFFSPGMNVRFENQLKMETALKRAIANAELHLQYQPRICAHTRQMIGVEALLRWVHPEWGLVPPARFIPQLEESGMIVAVGAWVIREACRQNKEWQDMGLPPLRISVNLSLRQFRSESLIHTVQSALAESKLDPCYFEMELTESLLAENTENAIQLMHALKKLGIMLSIDDFGTGYSSLSYLKRFPIDCLKIDRSFIMDIVTNPKDAAIVEAISALAKSLGIGLVAEGVENIDQARLLQKFDCTEMQGYFYSPPLIPDHIVSFNANDQLSASKARIKVA